MARNDMFSWLLGKKQQAEAQSAAIEQAARVETNAPAPPPIFPNSGDIPLPGAEAASDAKAETGFTPQPLTQTPVDEQVNEQVVERADEPSPVLPAPEEVAGVAQYPHETVEEPAAAAPAPETAPAEPATAAPPDATAEATVVAPEQEPSFDEPAAVAPQEVVAEVVVPTRTEPEPQLPRRASKPKAASSVLGANGDLQPTVGMPAVIKFGRDTRPALVCAVKANGRRVFAKADGTSVARPFTRRQDGSYRLDGQPDGAPTALELEIPGSAPAKGPSSPANQWSKPLRYVKRRRSPGFSVGVIGRFVDSDLDNVEAREHGSTTGRRPVIKGPIRTPRRSKAGSRMPSSSK